MTQYTQYIMWQVQATDGVSPIENEGTRGYEFGIASIPVGDFMDIINKVNAIYHGGSREATELYLFQQDTEGLLYFEPTDGLMGYFLLCDNAAGGGGVSVAGSGATSIKTMVPITTGNTKNFTLRILTSDGTRRHATDFIGCRIFKHSSHIDYLQQRTLMDTALIKSVSWAVSGYQGDLAPTFADGVALASQKPYVVDSRHILSWDGDNLAGFMVSWNYTTIPVNKIDKVQAQMLPFNIRSGDLIYSISMEVRRDGALPHSVYVDFLAQSKGVQAGKTHIMKIYQSATQFRQYTFGACVLMKMPMNRDPENPTYKMEILCKSMEWVEDDGVIVAADGFYGIADV